jgi:hypothetical protein
VSKAAEGARTVKRGDTVLLSANGRTYRAMVRRIHRDGDFTAEVQFLIEGGKPVAPYLGYRYRYEPRHLLKIAGAPSVSRTVGASS